MNVRGARRSSRAVAAAMFGTVLLAALAGCAGSPATTAGVVSVTYVDDGAEKNVEVAVPGLSCTTMGQTIAMHSTEERGADPWMFGVTGTDGAYAVLVQLDEDHWFLGDRSGVAVDDDGVQLDAASGSVVLGPDAADGVVDPEASAAGSLRCTER